MIRKRATSAEYNADRGPFGDAPWAGTAMLVGSISCQSPIKSD